MTTKPVDREELLPVGNARTMSVDKHLRLLALGPGGTGKTTQEITLPGKKFAYIFDPNALASIQGYDIDVVQFVPNIMDLDLSVKTLKKDVKDTGRRTKIEPITYIEWEEDFEMRVESDFFDKYDWIIFDSFTTWAETIMDRVQYLNGRLGKMPEQDDWAAQMTTISNVFRVLTNLPCNLYCTGHTEIRQDDTTKKIWAQPIMTGRLRTRLPLLFSDIFAFDSDTEGDQAFFEIRTKQDRMHPSVRTSIRDLAPVVDVTITDWKKPEGQGIGALFKSHMAQKET